MALFTPQTLLFAGKWVFVGLIYFVLLVVLVAVRRDMALRLPAGQPLASTAVGRLLVNRASGQSDIRSGAVWLLKPENTLGADPANDLVLNDALVSSRHARLRWDGAGWWLEDLGSTNGTFVNGERIVPLTARRVPLGAQIQLGETVFQLQA
jgi:pSer/pThr/pTyr-binding forkhead associated (FHA) protein